MKNITIIMGLVVALCSNLTVANDQMKKERFDCELGSSITFDMTYPLSDRSTASVEVQYYAPIVGAEPGEPSEQVTEYKFENCAVVWKDNGPGAKPNAVRCNNPTTWFELRELSDGKPRSYVGRDGERVDYKLVNLSLMTRHTYEGKNYWNNMASEAPGNICKFVE